MPPIDLSDSEDQVELEYLPFFRVYNGGRVERYLVTTTALVPPSVDPDAAGVRSKDVVIPNSSGVSVPARIFLPEIPFEGKGKKLPLVIYFHGGGFLFESAFSVAYHGFVSSLAAEAQVVALSVEYRLAPEHPLPAAYTDALQSLLWVASHAPDASAEGTEREPWLTNYADFNKVFLAGDSAGGNIAHNMVAHMQEFGGMAIKGALLINPFFWGWDRHKLEMVEDQQRMLQPGHLDAICAFLFPIWKEDPHIDPLVSAAPGLGKLGCSKVLVAVAGRDLLCQRGRMYYDQLIQCGWNGEAELHETQGEDHIFHIFHPNSNKARTLMSRLVNFINKDSHT